MVADFLSGGICRLAWFFVEDVAEGDDAEVAGEFEIGAVDPGDFVIGAVLGVVGAGVVHAGGHFEFWGRALGQGLEEAIAGFLDVEVAHNEKVAVEGFALLLVGAVFDVLHQFVDFLFTNVFPGIPMAGSLGDVDGGDHEVEAARSERGAVGHAVELEGHGLQDCAAEADLAHEAGADDGALVIEEGHAFVVAGGIRDQDLVISGKQLLEAGQAAQIGLDLLDGDEVEALADVGDILEGPGLLLIGKLGDVPGGDQNVFVDLSARDAVQKVHQVLPFPRYDFGLAWHNSLPSPAGSQP